MFQTVLVEPLFNLLMVIYAVLPVRSFGLAIIVFTILVRLALWPLVNRQLHSQRALQQLQPEVARIRKESKGDRQKESQMLMELYKEREVSPFGSLLPLLVQIPIFIALFSVLRDIIKAGEIAKLAYAPVQHLQPVAQALAHGGVISTQFLGFINLAKPSVILALTAGLAQFLQTRQLSPKTPVDDQQARAMQSMTMVFPVFTFLIGLTLPSALALYWTTTSLMAILQQWLILRRDVEELEAADEAPKLPKKAPAKRKQS